MSDILKAPIYEGRPKLGEGRLEKEIRTYDRSLVSQLLYSLPYF